MMTAKLFKSGGSQAVRLPKALRFKGTEVIVEKIGDTVLLRPKRKHSFESLGDVARYLAEKYPGSHDFPDIPRPKKHERSIVDLSW